ncbi:MAG: hypothetical protein Q6358_10265 [Candidatus Brocadiales bacterium]|nr:hypothetical protein [Candidatus Brocadiales bacterium]
MFQTAIGRIGSKIVSAPQSLEMRVFLDAGGKANRRRVWGGLALIGERELDWLQKVLDDIRAEFPIIDIKKPELKGRDLPTSVIKAAGRKLREEDRRILFWANWLPAWNEQAAQKLSVLLAHTLKSMRPNPNHFKQHAIETWYRDNADYFSNLKKDVNRHKLLSIVAHFQWLATEIARIELGYQLKSVEVVIDRENFPIEEKCGVLIKSFVAAALQCAGMDCTLTGRAYRERENDGAIVINVAGESENSVGIRYVDLLLQTVLRKVEPIT